MQARIKWMTCILYRTFLVTLKARTKCITCIYRKQRKSTIRLIFDHILLYIAIYANSLPLVSSCNFAQLSSVCIYRTQWKLTITVSDCYSIIIYYSICAIKKNQLLPLVSSCNIAQLWTGWNLTIGLLFDNIITMPSALNTFYFLSFPLATLCIFACERGNETYFTCLCSLCLYMVRTYRNAFLVTVKARSFHRLWASAVNTKLLRKLTRTPVTPGTHTSNQSPGPNQSPCKKLKAQSRVKLTQTYVWKWNHLQLSKYYGITLCEQVSQFSR